MENLSKLIKPAFVVAIFIWLAHEPVLAEDKSCEHDANNFRCVKFLKNYDVDTVKVEIRNVHPFLGHNAGVRVKGIDGGEMKGSTECEKRVARIAQKLTENLLKNAKRIDLQNIEKEKYGRILADVIYDGKNLKDILLQNGVAVPYDGGKKQTVDWCRRLPALSLPDSKN